jgi:hypothetical protein
MTDTPIETPTPSRHPDTSNVDTGIRFGGTNAGTLEPAVARLGVRGSGALAPIEIDKLYPVREGSGQAVVRALELLAQAIDFLNQARVALREDGASAADRCTQRFKLLLPELFACRKIGDGYALIINSLHFAFIHLHGKPLTGEQLTTVWRVLKELRNRPLVSFDQAIAVVSEIESIGFQVDPPILSKLLPDLEDE